jgi:ATP-dependent 26S proteasome regulatory subunit
MGEGGGADEDSTGVSARSLSALLNEIDGIQENHGLMIVACTNRIELVDPALLRPGMIHGFSITSY